MIPPIVLTVGVLQVFPVQLKATMWLLGIEYVILAMPFAYRAIDAGLRSIDLKTLTEASSNLGANWAAARSGASSCRTWAPRCSRRPC